LRELSPCCQLSCEEAVRRLLPDWDVSLEDVPFYLAVRFGPARIREAIAAIEPKLAAQSTKKQLRTVLYWLETYERAYGTN